MSRRSRPDADRSVNRSGREFVLRVASAAVLVPVAMACLWAGGVAWTVLASFFALGLSAEWIALCRRVRLPIATAILYRAGGLAWIALDLVALIWLRTDPGAGRANVLFLFPVIWATDTGAYAVGNWLGGPRLAPWISPYKTWSGAAGGVACATVAGTAIAALAGTPAGPAALVAALLGAVGIVGDLLESRIKRRFGAKDTSRLIPGHGGLLDRLDSVLAAAPLAALLAARHAAGLSFYQ